MFSHEDCNRIKPLLDAYLDGELNASESQTVEAHVSSCDACKRVLTEISQVVISLKRLPPAVVLTGRDFADDFERVLAEKTEKNQVCRKIRPALDAYYDGEMSSTESAEIAQHLDTCLNCRADVGDIGRIAGSLRELKPVEPPYDFANRFEEVFAQKTRVVLFKKPVVWGALAAVAAAVLAFAFHFVGPGTPSLAPSTVASNSAVKRSTVVANNPDQPAIKQPQTMQQNGKAAVRPQEIGHHQEHVAVANAVVPVNHAVEKDASIKQPSVVAQQISPALVNPPDLSRELAQLPPVAGANSAAPEIASYDPEHQQTTAEELGISTDEDGLYAIKL